MSVPGQIPNSAWQGKWGQQIDTMLAQGRRNSAARIIHRLRSGSLTGWTGHLNPFKSASFTSDAEPGVEGHPNPNPTYQSRLGARFRRMSVDPKVWKKHGNASLGSILSALYAKLLVVMVLRVFFLGMAFPMSEVISTYVPPAFYDGFYLYLYIGSILFMSWIFSHVIKTRAKREITRGVNSIKSRLHPQKSVSGSVASKTDDEHDEDDDDEERDDEGQDETTKLRDNSHDDDDNDDDHHGSAKHDKSLVTSNEEDKDTHSEDSNDKLSPLPTEDMTGSHSPSLHHRPIVSLPVPVLASPPSPLLRPAHLQYNQNQNQHQQQQQPPQQPPHHHHHHHHHVTIKSAPGHDGFVFPNPNQAITTHHHNLNHHVANNMHHILKKGETNFDTPGSNSPKSKGKLSRTQSVESSKYDYSGGRRSHFGSFYLRMGAVAFGVGSMIYSCLEFGQFLEQEPDTKCHSYMQAITPVVRIVFTFMQMYFIFLNSRMSVSKVSWVKQFGLMHLLGTNLCVWLNVLVQETKHEILHFYDPENGTITVGYGLTYYGKPKKVDEHAKVVAAATSSGSIASALIGDPFFEMHHVEDNSIEEDDDLFLKAVNGTANIFAGNGTEILRRLRRGLKGPHSIYECARENIMGSLVNNASPFLFPCTIEYSLICAAICYVMWKSMAQRRVRQITLNRTSTLETPLNHVESRNVHHYTVDCAGSNKGLFIGIFFLVFTIMSLILNFVLMKHHEHLELAFWEVNLTEITLYTVSTLAVIIGMCQMRQLRYEKGKNLELDNTLLIVAQSGSFMFNVFCIVGGHLTPLEHNVWILVTPLLCLIQLLLQTLFILDASKRIASTPEMARKKPGREIVTFLLVTNLAMWLINALEKSRGDSHPHLLRFYGVWAWTIITDISMPLAIFYRFHSTVCLCEIWKKAYKARNKYSNYDPVMHI